MLKDNFNEMLKLKGKVNDPKAQKKFYDWYNSLNEDEKRDFDKYNKKWTRISIGIIILLFLLLASSCFGINDKKTAKQETPQIEQSKSENQPASKPASTEETSKPIKTDILQTLFTQIDTSTTPNIIENVIVNQNLSFTKQLYNSTPNEITYKIAYEKDIALQRYGRSGDYLSISFNANDGSIMYFEYHNSKKFTTALFYNYGTYYDFNEKKPNNQYSGYYYLLDSMNTDGIEVKYSNGYTKKTGYHRVNSANTALSNII